MIAFVTGASRGIGRAIALMLAKEGIASALVARDARALGEVEREVRAIGGRALAIAADVTDDGALAAAIDRTVAELGGLDVLINNAGVAEWAHAGEAELAVWDRMLDVNLRAGMHATRLALPHVLRRGRGAIIFIASISGKITYAGGSGYCAGKYGILGFAGALFEDLRRERVKVCAICPGYVNTEMTSELGIPPAAMIQPDDVAEAVRFVLGSSRTSCPTEIVLRSYSADT